MDDGAATEGGQEVRIPPGEAALTQAERLRKNSATYNALPLEEKRRRRELKKAEKEKQLLDRVMREAAKRGAVTTPPPTDADPMPPTERSRRSTELPGGDSPDFERQVAGPPRNLLDLVALMTKLGDGSCFIQVTRLKPGQNSGISCAGPLRPITEPIDDHEFSQIYGGTEYTLRGYEYKDNGRARAVTEPVTYRVPGVPPNLASIPQPDEDPPMQPLPRPTHPNGSQFRRTGGIVPPHVANAEAEIHDRNLTHEEEMDARARADAEAKRRRLEAREERERSESFGMTKLMAEAKDKEVERLTEAHREQLRAANEKSQGSADIVELLKVLKPGDDTAKLSERHAAEIRQISESHKEQIKHLTDQQRAEVQRLTDMHAQTIIRLETQMRADRDRGDLIIRETDKRAADQATAANTRATEQVAAAEARAATRVEDTRNTLTAQYNDLKARSEERITDQNKNWEQRFADMKEAHARELKRKDDELALMKTGLEGNVAVILEGKDNENKRLRHELSAAKAEAESNKNWMGKMKEAGAAAEALGYVKPEAAGDGEPEPDDLKTFAAKQGLLAITKLPEMVGAIADGIAKLRNPGAPPDLARDQARSGARAHGGMRTMPRTFGGAEPPQLMQPLAFATDDGGYRPPSDNQIMPRPRMTTEPDQLMLEQSPTQGIVMQGPPPEPEQQPQQQQAPQPAAQQPELQHAAPQPQPVSSRSRRPHAGPARSPAVATGLDPTSLQVIGSFAPVLSSHFDQKTDPREIVQGIINENSLEIVRFAIQQVTIDQLIGYVTQNPGAHGQLASRTGQKFLREVWRNAEELTAVAG